MAGFDAAWMDAAMQAGGQRQLHQEQRTEVQAANWDSGPGNADTASLSKLPTWGSLPVFACVHLQHPLLLFL